MILALLMTLSQALSTDDNWLLLFSICLSRVLLVFKNYTSLEKFTYSMHPKHSVMSKIFFKNLIYVMGWIKGSNGKAKSVNRDQTAPSSEGAV